jgi:4-diphosphocytidyl-2-C-methyl-D-erythritol kinase
MIFTRTCSIKINLTLRVLGKREDGYHDICSLFWRRPSPETLEISGAEADGLSVEGIDVPGENLLVKARAFLRREYGDDALPPLHMKLVKLLPVGGGVGAGSGNAAELLRWFFSAKGLCGSGREEIERAASLGADVAFLASGLSLALAGGVGERLVGLKAPGLDLSAAIIFPKWSGITAEAYASLDRMREADAFFSPTDEKCAQEEAASVLRGLASQSRLGLLPNDFIPCTSGREECYNDLYNFIESSDALAWGLCGSGSSCFALFDRKNGADRISRLCSRLSKEESYRFAWLHKTLVLE